MNNHFFGSKKSKADTRTTNPEFILSTSISSGIRYFFDQKKAIYHKHTTNSPNLKFYKTIPEQSDVFIIFFSRENLKKNSI